MLGGRSGFAGGLLPVMFLAQCLQVERVHQERAIAAMRFDMVDIGPDYDLSRFGALHTERGTGEVHVPETAPGPSIGADGEPVPVGPLFRPVGRTATVGRQNRASWLRAHPQGFHLHDLSQSRPGAPLEGVSYEAELLVPDPPMVDVIRRRVDDLGPGRRDVPGPLVPREEALNVGHRESGSVGLEVAVP